MSRIEKWYVLDDGGSTIGPLSTTALTVKLENGELQMSCHCWCDGRDSWQCAEDIAEIQAALGASKAAAKKDKKQTNAVGSLEEIAAELKEERFVDDDGTCYVWNTDLKKYEPQPLKEYDQSEMTFDGAEETIPTLEEAKKKEEESAENVASQKRKENPSSDHQSDPKKTTSVYVTGLPLDATTEEVAVLFSKCGMLKEDDDGVRIKLYKNKSTGILKGDGLVTFMKRPSVELAKTILDGTPFRDNMKQTMTIQEATFEAKSERKTNKKHSTKKPKKVTREAKLLGWSGFDDHLSSRKVTVILSNMFQPKDLLHGELTKELLKEEVRSECQQLGQVDRVTVYDNNNDGVVSVRFRSEEAADACIASLNDRYYAGKQIRAAKWDGFTKYYKSQKPTATDNEETRLEQFAQDLERE